MMGKLFTSRWRADESRHLAIGIVLIAALIGFEIFNFDTTRFALMDVLGGLHFGGLEWASILSFAFCGIDFAGLIRLFTPEQGLDEPKEVWLLTGAWLIGATMNAVMTWYAVSLAIAPRQLGFTLLTHEEMLYYAPAFVAFLVWLTRILFIGAISLAADRLLHQNSRASQRSRSSSRRPRRAQRSRPVRQSNDGVDRFDDDLFD
jgi:hypothetical protein